MENRTVLKLFSLIAPWLTWLVALFLPGRNAAVAKRECANKCRIMGLVQSLGGYVDPEGKKPLTKTMEECYALGDFPALWAVEGVGKDLAEEAMKKTKDVKNLLTGPELGPEWDKAQTMMHAGAGLGFAKHYIERLPKSPSRDEVAAVVKKVVDLCRDNSRPGYYGAALESLGLVSRFLRSPEFCRQVHAALEPYAPDSVGFFWRGAGRCLYFHPSNFIPGLGARPCRAIAMSLEEAPTPAIRNHMHSGTCWALTVVNMSSPEVMEWTLAHPDAYDVANSSFANGVMSSVTMRYDTTPGFPLITSFRDHQPADPVVRQLWQTKIKGSIENVLTRIHPALSRARRVDEVFQFHEDLPGFAAGLAAQKANG